MGFTCPKCAFIGTSQTECPHCGIVFDNYYRFKAHSQAPRPDAHDNPESDNAGRVSFDDLLINAVSLPAAFVLAGIIHFIWILKTFAWYFISVPIHEFGHATVSWLGSRVAIPIGALIPMAAFTSVHYDRSNLLFMVFSLGIFYLSYRAVQAKRLAALFALGALFSVLIYVTWVMPAQSWLMWMVYGGVGGEFVLSTLFIVLFYYDLSNTIRWDFIRFPLLFAGCFGFLSAVLKWREIANGKADLPIGSFIQGSGDAAGDMDRLQASFGWSSKDIIASYNHLGKLCMIVIAIHYGIFLWVAFKNSQEN